MQTIYNLTANDESIETTDGDLAFQFLQAGIINPAIHVENVEVSNAHYALVKGQDALAQAQHLMLAAHGAVQVGVAAFKELRV